MLGVHLESLGLPLLNLAGAQIVEIRIDLMEPAFTAL